MQTISQTAARQSDRQTEDKVNLLPDLEELQEDIKFVLPRFVVKPTANTHPFEHRASICFLKILAIFAPAQVSVSFSLSLSLYRSRCRILSFWACVVACLCGVSVWRICVAYLCDVSVWRVFVAYLCGVSVWRICVACLCGVSVWRVCVTCLCGGVLVSFGASPCAPIFSSVVPSPPLTTSEFHTRRRSCPLLSSLSRSIEESLS